LLNRWQIYKRHIVIASNLTFKPKKFIIYNKSRQTMKITQRILFGTNNTKQNIIQYQTELTKYLTENHFHFSSLQKINPF
jgi:hypothetical protein